jgi:replicative DNA helicase
MEKPKITPESSVKSLADYNGEGKIISFQERWDSLQLDKAIIHNIKSGLPYLDTLTSGFESGELIIVSGPTKGGKSLLLQSLTYAFGPQNVFTVWFSYEMTALQFLRRFPGAPVMPVAFLPEKLVKNTLKWIEERIIEAKIKHDCRVVMIDHLGFIADDEIVRGENQSQALGRIVRKIKTMAIRNNVIIFLIHHIEKIPAGTRPSYHHMRDSGLVACDSDKVLMIWRLEDDEQKGLCNRSDLSVELDRRTGAFQKIDNLIFQNGLLYEVEKKQKEPEKKEPDGVS